MNAQGPLLEVPEAGSLIPPRPNLGPEPWPEEGLTGGWVALAVALMLVLGLSVMNRRRSQKKTASPSAITNQSEAAEPSPRQKLISTSEEVRESLFLAFGTGWRSKTTEEISHDPKLIEKLDPAEFDHLIALLKLADRAKFAEDEPDSLEAWEAWAVGIIARLASKSEHQREHRE